MRCSLVIGVSQHSTHIVETGEAGDRHDAQSKFRAVADRRLKTYLFLSTTEAKAALSPPVEFLIATDRWEGARDKVYPCNDPTGRSSNLEGKGWRQADNMPVGNTVRHSGGWRGWLRSPLRKPRLKRTSLHCSNRASDR